MHNDHELQLQHISEGRLMLAANDLLRDLAKDIARRKHIEKQRELNIKIKIKPRGDGVGGVDIEYKVTPKTPESLPELECKEMREVRARAISGDNIIFQCDQLDALDGVSAEIHQVGSAQG